MAKNKLSFGHTGSIERRRQSPFPKVSDRIATLDHPRGEIRQADGAQVVPAGETGWQSVCTVGSEGEAYSADLSGLSVCQRGQG